MTSPEGTQQTFSKRTGCLHAVLVAVVFILTLGVVAAVRGRDPGAAGELAGRLLLVVAPLGFLASYFYQRGRKLLASGLVVVLWTALPAFLLIATHRLAVTEAEKQHLEVLPDHIHHSDFGFVLPNPGKDFHLVTLPPEASAVLAAEPVGRETFVWMLRNEDSSEVVMVVVLKSLNMIDEQAFRDFVEGLRGSFRSMRGAKSLEDSVVWVPGVHEYRFGLRIENGLYGRMRCLASLSAPPVCVCAQTWASESTGLDFVRAGLSFERLPSR